MTYVRYFNNTLKRLGLEVSLHNTCELMHNHNFHYKRFRRFYEGQSNKTNNYLNIVSSLVGGTKNNDNTKIKYMFEGHIFIIFKDSDEYNITYAIHQNDDINLSICMLLMIEPDEKIIYIENISMYSNCTKIGMPKTKGGTLLLNLTLDFIKKVLKPKYNLKYIQLRDNSNLYCEKTKTSIEFDSFYMLTHGNTWYGKYGFIPFDVNTNKVDKIKLKQYKKNQELVKTKLQNTNVLNIIKSLHSPTSEKQKSIDKYFEENKNMTVQEFISEMAHDFKHNCKTLHISYKKIMEDIGMTNLHGSTYYLPL